MDDRLESACRPDRREWEARSEARGGSSRAASQIANKSVARHSDRGAVRSQLFAWVPWRLKIQVIREARKAGLSLHEQMKHLAGLLVAEPQTVNSPARIQRSRDMFGADWYSKGKEL
jgi:hypothetical protein